MCAIEHTLTMFTLNRALWSSTRNLSREMLELDALSYKALMRSIVDNVKIIWDPHPETNCAKLETIQRLAAIFIVNKQSLAYSPTELCELAKVPKLKSRTKYDRLIFSQIIHNNVKLIKWEHFKMHSYKSSIRLLSVYIPCPSGRNDCLKFSFLLRAMK